MKVTNYLLNGFEFLTVSGTGRKLSDGDYLEKTLEFPKVLKQLNTISGFPILKEDFLQFYAPLKSISESCVNESKIYLQGLEKFEPWAIESKYMVQ